MLLNTTPTLRHATQADWPAIEALLLANKLPTDGAQSHLKTYLLAISNGEVVGSAGAEIYGQIALLRSVAVAPGLHKQGIGKLLLESLSQEARRRDIGTLYLLTVPAPEYFAQYGFERGKIADAPPALKVSAELQGPCPACAAFMSLALQEAPRRNEALPVAVLGAGPVGLAAAAELLERSIPFVILEAGKQVGANLLDYGHVRLFSPWQYNVDAAMAKHLARTGWQAPPPAALPLAREVAECVLQPFVALPEVAVALKLKPAPDQRHREQQRAHHRECDGGGHRLEQLAFQPGQREQRQEDDDDDRIANATGLTTSRAASRISCVLSIGLPDSRAESLA